MIRALPSLGIVLFCVGVHAADAQVWKSSRWEQGLKDRYQAHIDVVYGRPDTGDVRLDVYVPKAAREPHPTLIWIHGGGWGRLSKDSVSGQVIPFLEAGWVVVNVDYRLAARAPAPAAVIDCRCALHWVVEHAERFMVDTRAIVVSGTSAGGHLALMTGMLPGDTPYGRSCAAGREARVAAIVNFYGITDVVDLLDRANKRGYAVRWLAETPDREEIARSVSPLTYVRGDLPPIFTVHGDADPTVPYQHAVRLHKALDGAGVPNELYTVPGGKHGKFGKEANAGVLRAVASFLRKHNITTADDMTIGGAE